MSVVKRLAQSSACGVIITAVLTWAAFRLNSDTFSGILLWHAALFAGAMSALTGPGPLLGHDAQGNPMYEGTPVHLLFFFVGVLLGVPIYAALCYAALSWRERRARRELR